MLLGLHVILKRVLSKDYYTVLRTAICGTTIISPFQRLKIVIGTTCGTAITGPFQRLKTVNGTKFGAAITGSFQRLKNVIGTACIWLKINNWVYFLE